MSNPTTHIVQTTSVGPSPSLSSAPKQKSQKADTVDDTKHTVHTFLDLISVAKSSGQEWVETTPEIIAHYNRQGLKGAKYFLFNGVKVCEIGQKAAILAEIDQPLSVKLHGAEEGKVLHKV